MSDHTKRMAEEIWDALGASLYKRQTLERIEAVITKDLDNLEKALLTQSATAA